MSRKGGSLIRLGWFLAVCGLVLGVFGTAVAMVWQYMSISGPETGESRFVGGLQQSLGSLSLALVFILLGVGLIAYGKKLRKGSVPREAVVAKEQ